MRLAALLLVAAFLAAACSGGDDTPNSIPVTVDPTAVTPGGTFSLTAGVGKEWDCSTTIVYPGVGAVRGGKGGVEETDVLQRWTREVPADAQPGTANIAVYCEWTERGPLGAVGTGLATVEVVAQ